MSIKTTPVVIRGRQYRFNVPIERENLLSLALGMLAKSNADLRDLLIDASFEVRDDQGEMIFPLEDDTRLCPFSNAPLEQPPDGTQVVTCLCGRSVAVKRAEDGVFRLVPHRPGDALAQVVARSLRPKAPPPQPAAPSDGDLVEALIRTIGRTMR